MSCFAHYRGRVFHNLWSDLALLFPFLNHNRKSFPKSSESGSASFVEQKKRGGPQGKKEKFIVSMIWAMKKGNGILEKTTIFRPTESDDSENVT